MSRFSELAPGQGRYVNAADKAALADAGAALRIVGAVYQPRATFGPRWLIECALLATGELVAIDFAAAAKDGTPIDARMSMFGAVRDRIDAGDVFDPVVLVQITPAKGGNAFWTFEDASADQIAHPTEPAWPDAPADDAPPAPVAGERLRSRSGR